MPYTYDRLIEPPRQSFFLFGMRGVGKSTWARAAFPDAVYIDLLDEKLYQDLLGDPSLFEQSLGQGLARARHATPAGPAGARVYGSPFLWLRRRH